MEDSLTITVGSRRDILTLAYEELSGIAQRAAADDGSSLYDAVIPHSNDAERLCDMLDDALSVMLAKLRDVQDFTDCRPASAYSDTQTGGSVRRVFLYLPDLPESGSDIIGRDMRRYFVLYVVAQLLRERYKPLAEEYGTMCDSQLTLAVSQLLRREMPRRRCLR